MKWEIEVRVQSELEDELREFDISMPRVLEATKLAMGTCGLFHGISPRMQRIAGGFRATETLAAFSMEIGGELLGLQLWMERFLVEFDREFRVSGLIDRWSLLTVRSWREHPYVSGVRLYVSNYRGDGCENWIEGCLRGEERDSVGWGDQRYHRINGPAFRGDLNRSDQWYVHGHLVDPFDGVLAGRESWQTYMCRGVWHIDVILALAEAGLIEVDSVSRENLEAGVRLVEV